MEKKVNGKLIEIANISKEIMNEEKQFRTHLSTYYTRESIYHFNDIETDNFKLYDTEIKITNRTTLDAIYDSPAETKIGVLNFASPTTPGGGWDKGILAQEESLARNSNLMNYLNKFQSFYYNKNKKSRGINSPNVIYSHDVTFWSNDEKIVEHVINADVITCSAPNKNYIRFWQKFMLKYHYKERIYNILRTAQLNDVQHLILGAWGCGVFKNNPNIIAKIFKETIDEYFSNVFKSIEFAVYDKDHNTPNYNIFKNIFFDNDNL